MHPTTQTFLFAGTWASLPFLDTSWAPEKRGRPARPAPLCLLYFHLDPPVPAAPSSRCSWSRPPPNAAASFAAHLLT